MFIVGERINATRKSIGEAVQRRDTNLIQQEAIRQVDAGADVLDVNGGFEGQDVEHLPWLVQVVQEVVDTPLCLDSPNAEAVRRALPLCKHRPLLNSITDEPDRQEQLVPLVKEYKPKVIALCMSSEGLPTGAEDRLEIATRLVERLTEAGVQPEDMYLDPGIFPISSTPEQVPSALEALGLVTARYPQVHTIGGMSNVSFGLPVRKLLNTVFLIMAMARGLDSAIIDPTDRHIMASIAAAEALLGRDEYCARYLRAYRGGKLGPEEPQEKQR